MAPAAHQLCNQNSGNVELYTPASIITAARQCLGGIDLDPASSETANQVVKASRFYDVNENGLLQPWAGNVWMNHPYGRAEKACVKGCKKKTCRKRKFHRKTDFPGNAPWVNKLISSYKNGQVKQALCITFMSSSESWFKPLMEYPQCVLFGRTRFSNPDGSIDGSAPKGCVVTYLGPNLDRFAQCFGTLGEITISYAQYKRTVAA